MKKEANKVPFDGPIQIAKIDSENSSKIIWDRELIKNIFCAKEIANLTVAIISIAGAYRQGKSFLLNFFIMFLRALKENYIYVPSSEWKDFDWLYDDQVIKGFEYKAGTDRVTTGIWMWGEPIVVPARNGKLMAIVLLDTQGAFDMVATTNESKNIFALSTGLSSVQIYNVSKMFQEDQMQHLALFAQCGQAIKQQEENRVVKSKGRQSSIVKKKFQKLLIVIRDHQNDEQYSLGKTGGTMLIEDALKEQNNGISNPEAILVRKYIKENFETIEGFNLPHPGFDVSIQTRRFDGAVSKIEKQFKEFAKKLVVDTMLFAMLEPKSVDGVPITCDFMPLLFEQFVSGCENQDKIRGFCDALENIEHSQICTTAATNSMEYYLKEMKLACTNRISSDEQLNDISKKAMDKFLEETQDVSERNHHIRKQHEEELTSEIKKFYEICTASEDPKRILHTLLGLVWSTIIFIEQCIPLLNKSKKNRSKAKLAGNGVSMVSTAVTVPLLFVPGLFVIPIAIGGVGLATQLTTRVSTWAVMKHMKNKTLREIERRRAEIKELSERLERSEAVLRSDKHRKMLTAEGFRFASKVLASGAGKVASTLAPVIAQSSRFALAARFGTETISSLIPFAKVAGTPFLFLSFGIDAYDTFALIRDFKKPSEMSEHLEKKVLPEFTKARIHLSRELNRKLGVTRAMEIIERKREDISRRESLPPPFTEDRITLRTRCDSI